MYVKLSRISLYTAKSQEIGKIINMLSNDFNTVELKAPILFASIVAPFALVGILAILITRFGWPGILVIVVILVFIPIQGCVGKINGQILAKVNVNKD